METLIANYSKKVKNLREKKYVVRPIRRKGGWVGPDHDSSFMNDGAKLGIVVPVLPGEVLFDPLIEFNQEDRKMFADELGLESEKEFNVHLKQNYWKRKTIFLDRNGLFLNLDKTDDLVKFLVLRSDTERISPNWSNRFDRGTYKFALCEEGEELVDRVSNLEEKKNAYIYLGKIDKSAEKMRDFLYVYYITKKDAKRPPSTANLDWLKGELGRIIEEDLKIFLTIASDVDYNTKLLIQKSIEIGALSRVKHNYYFPGAETPVGTIEDLIGHLDDPKNQDAKMKLLHQIENVK